MQLPNKRAAFLCGLNYLVFVRNIGQRFKWLRWLLLSNRCFSDQNQLLRFRARLFGSAEPDGSSGDYPWNKNPDGTPHGPKDDLAAARTLIEQCGYGRRKEELEDAEAAIR